MELTIEQVLQQGVAAHNAGSLREAERLYRVVLQSQPSHPDANHNLGLITLSVNKADAALPLLKAAVEANPKIEQFWLSYIDALVKANRLKDAKREIKKAKKKGFNGKKLQALLSQSNKAIDTKAPSEKQVSCLVEHYNNGRFVDAEKLAISITQEFPTHQLGWKALGAIFGQIGRTDEALNANQKAVALSPDDAEAHSNLGNTLQELERLDEAKASYNNAIALEPNFAEVHSNLGNTLKELGRLDEAEASYNRAITLKPDYADAHYNLGITLQELGRLNEAVPSYTRAIALKADYADAYVNLSLAIKNLRFNSANRKLYPPLTQLLTNGNFSRPNDVAKSILSLLKHDPLIKDLLLEKNCTKSLTEVTSTIVSLDKLSLLHHLMRLCPLPDLKFEGFFVTMRRFLLTHLDRMESSSELIYFLSTLSLQCFVNEYVYAESDEETHLIGELQADIMHVIAQTKQPEAKKVLCLASYRPLHKYDWCKKLEALDNLKEVKVRLIEEPLAETVIAQDIPVLGHITDNVSLKVRAQYEENPYPRWVKTGIALKARSVSEVCDDENLYLHSESIKSVIAPAILIAGCGTGQHAIGTASRFSNCRVTAVDLSLASLAYAWRKTTELKITNLEYLQGDILELGKLEQEFDIIESLGVLHHMDEPMAGWRVLIDLLKPGGLIKIGLYSELARRHIAEIREEIKLQKVGMSEIEIRESRGLMADSYDPNHQLLTMSSDFFSLSTLRDLIFHVKEHRFTLPQIKNCLDELGLKFCGFENRDVISNFRKFHGEGANMYDLALWHHYEKSNPRAFAGMYQFWCQKL